MQKTVVLICDDSAAVHESLERYLQADGIHVLSVYDGESALERFRAYDIDLIILDIMLPGIPGTEVCSIIRRSSDVPIIMLSARDDEYDRIIGLGLGADDYVTKPFSPREVAMRVRTVLRRQRGIPATKKFMLAELTVFPDSYEVFVNDERISMRPKEIEVLSYLIENVGKVLSREQILNAVWGYEYYGDTRVVDTQIKRIRQKLASGVHFAIRSIYGAGYKLEEA